MAQIRDQCVSSADKVAVILLETLAYLSIF